MRPRVVIPLWLLEGAVRPPQTYVVLWRAPLGRSAAAPLGTVVATTRAAALTTARLRWPAAVRRLVIIPAVRAPLYALIDALAADAQRPT